MTAIAYEALQPYCGECGRALVRPDSQAKPSSYGVEVRCECGAVMAASFWTAQTSVLRKIEITTFGNPATRAYVDAVATDGAKVTTETRR